MTNETPKRECELQLTDPHCTDCEIREVERPQRKGQSEIRLRVRSSEGIHAIRLVPAPNLTLELDGQPLSESSIVTLFDKCDYASINRQDSDYLPPYHVLEFWKRNSHEGFMCAIRAVECDYELVEAP